MIGGFRKTSKRANIRRKITTDDSDEEGGVAANESVNITIEKPIKPIKKSSSALSFGDELQNEDEFVLKRSKASINMSEQTKKEKKIKKKKEKNKNDENGTINTDTVSVVQSSINEMVIKTFDDEEPVDNYDGITFDATHKFTFKDKYNKSGNAIPDAATIYAMKKQREQARQFSGQVNYIPISTNKYEGRFSKEKSRLVREEMDDSSDDERLEMKGSTKETHPALERRKQVAQALEEVQDEDDLEEKQQGEDDELQRWEDEQIKKGSKMPTNQKEVFGPKLPDPNMAQGLNYNLDPTSLYNNMYDYNQQLGTYAPEMLPSYCAIPQAQQDILSADSICKRLNECLETKKKLHELHTLEKEKTDYNLESSKSNIIDLKRKNEDVADRFTFYQDIRGFVKDLLECLNEKVKLINSLEQSMHEVLKVNSIKLQTRRQNDVKDEMDEIGGKPNTATDRITNIKNRRIAEREARRSRRREKRRNEDSLKDHNEGLSSDDEMIPSDTLRFQADKVNIMKQAETVFSDVVSDFSSIEEIKSRFEQWKFGFNDSYKEAYLGLCLPKLFTPFIKLELLNWNPLEVNSENDFEETSWFRILSLYGDLGGEVLEDDDDIKLLPNIIEKVLLPKLIVLMRDVWDPVSSTQTKLAAFLFQRLTDDYPTITAESKQTKNLVEVIVSKLKNAIETDIYIPLYPKTQLETNNSRALAFLERQFWKGVKLLENIMIWNWLLSVQKLRELGIDAILNRYLIIALQQFPDPLSALEKSKMIINVLPKEWFDTSEKIVPGLQSFARLLITIATNTFKCSLGYTGEAEKKKMKIGIKKIISLLMHIQAFDDARFVATNFKEEVKKDSPSDSPRTL